jgi:hypothetical protein
MSSGMIRRMALVNRRFGGMCRSKPRLLVTANVAPSSQILVTLMEAIRFPETSVLTTATRRNMPVNGSLQTAIPLNTNVHSGKQQRCTVPWHDERQHTIARSDAMCSIVQVRFSLNANCCVKCICKQSNTYDSTQPTQYMLIHSEGSSASQGRRIVRTLTGSILKVNDIHSSDFQDLRIISK